MKAKMTVKNISTSLEVIEITSVKVTKEAHNAARVHVAKGGARNLTEYVSNLIILDKKRRK